MTPLPTKEQVKKWVHEANHNEPMFYQVACLAAEWAYLQTNVAPLENKTNQPHGAHPM